MQEINSNLSLDFWSKKPSFKRKVLQNIIVDRRSKYTVTSYYVENKEEVELSMKELLKDKYFIKATHNTYAYRLKLESWVIVEWKNDDWETWAWNCILREIQREDFVNTLVIVTRYFWGIHLQADRFKNVIDATKLILKEIWK